MSDSVNDNYGIYYADKLWNLLPAIYRTLDTDQFALNRTPATGESGTDGPLRELVNRIGCTTATLRRGIDRLWEDQSIETCDDWVIPYIAALLDTRLVLGLEARGQRLDVANTIDYRRRKGTLGLLEQIANDITGWDAKAVEFFRRLARSRHGLDPAIGPVAGKTTARGQLQRAEGLVGRLTHSRIGGFADLRNVQGARQSRTAFDEFFHTADTRFGQGLSGWQNIPHLGIFIWRLLSQEVGPATPVAVLNCPGWYCFDPTGRDIPLFAPPRSDTNFGNGWVSPVEGQLPGPISQALLNADLKAKDQGLQLYPKALSVWQDVSASPPLRALLPRPQPSPGDPLQLRPERGRFAYRASPPAANLLVKYYYGFPSFIGAGTYDRRGQAITVPPLAPSLTVHGGGDVLNGTPPDNGTFVLGDSLTYNGIADLNISGPLTVQALNRQRPLIRLNSGKPWTITGASADASLTMDGLFISGGDIILAGQFGSVTITCSTLDPGNASGADIFGNPDASPPVPVFLSAADGRELVPVRLWIAGSIAKLTIDRSVIGPVRSVTPGNAETTSISNSTIQAIRSADAGALIQADVKDPLRLLQVMGFASDPVTRHLQALNPALATLPVPPSSPPGSGLQSLLDELNKLLGGVSLYDGAAFSAVALTRITQSLLAATKTGQPAPALNRLLLEDAYPQELADAALAFADGTLNLSRCTVMGRVQAHRLEASECILHELTVVDDRQDGCLRFSAWAQGSQLPKQYECVQIAQLAALFTTVSFGQPGYAQLLATVDSQIMPVKTPSATPQNTISAGAGDGSEMGAYGRDKNPIRAQALLLKLQEYMPANLTPILIDVT